MNTEQLLRQYNNKVVRGPDGLQAHPINNNMVDIFHGEGWTNQSRYRRIKGKWTHVGGVLLPQAMLTSVLK